jgi:quercetin dioxygenase-like cupin family protein
MCQYKDWEGKMNTNKHLWGHEIIWANRDKYSGRVLVIKEGESTSYVYNKIRDKTIFVLQGIVQAKIEGQNKLLNEGDDLHISPNIMHNFTALRGDATILEAGTKIVDDEINAE